MTLGFIVAVLPYIGIPYDITKWIWTLIGLAIVFLLFFSQKGKLHYVPYSLDEEEDEQKGEEVVRELHVLRHEEEDRPEMHIEKDIVTDISRDAHGGEEVKVTETKVTTMHKRKKKSHAQFSPTTEEVHIGE